MKVNKTSRLVLLIEGLNSGDFQRNNQWTTVLSTMTCERSLERMGVGEEQQPTIKQKTYIVSLR